MAGSAQTATMQAIALQTLSSPPSAQGIAEAIEGHVAHQPNSGTPQQASNNVEDHANVGQEPTTTPQPPPSGHLASPSPNVPVPCTDDSNSNNGTIYRVFRNTPIGNAIGLLGLVLTLGLGLFGGIASYRDMKWSEHANAVQTCASLFSIGHFSEFCNSTIEDGIDTTPLLRRLVMRTRSGTPSHLLLGLSPLTLASTVFSTITAVLLGLLFTRPRMRPFAPLISNVRLEVTNWVQGFRRVRYAPGSKVTAETLLLLEEELLKKQKELLRTSALIEDPPDHVWFSEDVEDHHGECISESCEEDSVDSRMSSSAGDERLPKVRMAEVISTPADAEDIEDDIPVEGLEAPVQGDLLNENDSVSKATSEVRSVADKYFERRGDVLVFQERLKELDYEKEEEPLQREFLRERNELPGLRDEALELSDEEFELKYQMRRQEIELDLRTAQEDSDILRQRCIDAGHDPDYRTPSVHSLEFATRRKSHLEEQSDTEIADAKEAAELSEMRTRLSDLEFVRRSASDLRMLRRFNGSELSITDEAFEGSFSEEREVLNFLIEWVANDCEALDVTCIKAGLDPDKYIHIPSSAEQIEPRSDKSRIDEWLQDISSDCPASDIRHINWVPHEYERQLKHRRSLGCMKSSCTCWLLEDGVD